jgi:hypothetical protein
MLFLETLGVVEAAQADLLRGPSLEVAVAARANDHRGYMGFLDPVTILLEGLGRPFGLNVFSGLVGHESPRTLREKPLFVNALQQK